MTSLPQTNSIELYGSKVHYWTFNPNKNETILMLHGFRGTHHGLQDIIDQLGDYKIIVPDLPNFGESTPMRNKKHNITGYRDLALALIATLKLKPLNLLGHSFGSIVAAAVAAAQPDLLSKLILVNPIAEPATIKGRSWLLAGTRAYYQLGGKLPKVMGNAMLSNSQTVLGMSRFLAKTKDKALQRKIHQNHLQHFSSFQDPKILYETYKASINQATCRFAPKVATPTLLIAGSIDDIAPLDGQKKLQKLLNAKLVVLNDVGHLIHYEKATEAANAIRSFLTAVASASN